MEIERGRKDVTNISLFIIMHVEEDLAIHPVLVQVDNVFGSPATGPSEEGKRE